MGRMAGFHRKIRGSYRGSSWSSQTPEGRTEDLFESMVFEDQQYVGNHISSTDSQDDLRNSIKTSNMIMDVAKLGPAGKK